MPEAASGASSPRPDDPRAQAAGEASAEAAEVVDPRPEPGTDRGAAAFFDVDNTLLRGASIFYLARGLYRREFFRMRDLAGMARKQVRFRLLGEHLGHVADIQEQALSLVAGHSVAELAAVGEEVWDEIIVDKVWPGTHAIAQRHLDAGQRVWLVTATPVEVADVIARRLGLTGALGTVAEHVDGVYTGRLVGEPLHGEAKAAAVEALAEREGLDLARCAAYSDSSNDIPLLSLVGQPCAINPDGALRAHARDQGWRVRDFRRGRRAARVGLPAAAGAVVGAAVTSALRRRR